MRTYHKFVLITSFEPHSWRGVLDTTLCDKVCHRFSLGTPVSSTNKTDCHDITEILLKVMLNTITLTPEIGLLGISPFIYYTPRWQSVLLVEETGVPRENLWQTLSHNVVSSTPRHEWGSNEVFQWIKV
jgi:hypothetical protein